MMMSIHIGATKGQIAQTVLLPGDPLRAKHIAETMLEDHFCYNEIRGMLGYTGRFKGKDVSVMGTGMGIPSMSIYVHELINDYGVNCVIRVGTCGALQPELRVGELVIPITASTNSHINKLRFHGMDYAPVADFPLLLEAYNKAVSLGAVPRVGGILTSDTFYADDLESWQLWAAYGALVGEMETSGLFTLAAKYKIRALSILTVSDNIITGESSTPEERERSFNRMVEIALEIAPDSL
jgi:purine-nucleoside phosphorylase